MSLGKRHIGRRVAGVGVAVALMVLGLQAPAFANTAVTAVAPSSGPADCVVDITGTGFRTFPDAVNTLTFVAPTTPVGDVVVANADWFSNSDTDIWAIVPALAVGTTYTVKLSQPSGTFTAGGTFLSTGIAGGAAYNASKFGLNGFSEALMMEVRYDGIRVAYVMPGSVATDFGRGSTAKQGWALTADDVAEGVLALLRAPRHALFSRIEMRPSQPPRKG